MSRTYLVTTCACLLTVALVILFSQNMLVALLSSTVCVGCIGSLALVWQSTRGMIDRVREVETQRLQSYRQMDDKVGELLQIVTQASLGNLTGRPSFKGNDPIDLLAVGIRDMLEDLSDLARRLQKLGIELTNSTHAIATQSRSQEQAASEQVHSVANVLQGSQAMDSISRQLVSMMRQVADTCDGTARLAQESQDRYQKLREVLAEMLSATGSVIARLGNLSEKADAINQVVTSFAVVAHDTNLLYINSAIAAEKAGEFGKGFHAVAQEVRRVADRNSVSALEIEQSVEELQTAVRSGGQQMKGFVTKIETDATSLVDLGAQLVDVGFQVQTLSPRFEEAVVEVEAQSRSAHQIVEQIKFVSDSVQQNAEALKVSNEALARVHSVAHELKSVIAEFVVDE